MAQAARGTRQVAVLLASTPAAASHLVNALIGGLAELGWADGRNLHLDVRYGENDPARTRSLAAQQLDQKPDLVVAVNEQVAREVAALTKTLPIVVPIGFDLVGSGLVQSLARPGGNVTGLSVLLYELMPKRLALLKEAVPRVTRVAVLYRTEDPNADRVLTSLAEPARILGITIIRSEIRDIAQWERTIEQASQQKAGGILQAPDSFFFQNRTRIAELTIKHGLVSCSNSVEAAQAGSLFSYGVDFVAVLRRSATLVDKIFKGANPASMPVEQANVFELVVNLKTARRLGINLPRTFMLQATQTIE
jgi:putative ABC transport system substrate-binding protein